MGVAIDGRCTCGLVRFRLTRAPTFVMACHCTWCQCETGSAFATLALIEMSELVLLDGTVDVVDVGSPSGAGQWVRRCPVCRVALWSHYGGPGSGLAFVRLGTLEDPGAFPPQVHCHASTRQDWLVLDGRVPVEPEGFDDAKYYPAESLARVKALTTASGTG